MPVIFISYRRSDSQDVTGRIYDRLVSRFDRKQVFKDVDNTPLGVSFPLHIQQMLGKSGIVLVIIGPTWLNAADEQGRRRLNDPNDFVRVEVETALRANIPVVPVLVSNASMPLAGELPSSIRKLMSRNGIKVRPDPDFNNDMNRLFTGIEHLIEHLEKMRPKPKQDGARSGDNNRNTAISSRSRRDDDDRPRRRGGHETRSTISPLVIKLGGSVAMLVVVLIMVLFVWPGVLLPTNQQKIVGTWELFIKGDKRNTFSEFKVQFTADRQAIITGKDFEMFTVKGGYAVTSDRLTTTIGGDLRTDKIKRLTSTELILENDEGKIEEYRRK